MRERSLVQDKRAARGAGALLSLCQHHQKTHKLTLTLRTRTHASFKQDKTQRGLAYHLDQDTLGNGNILTNSSALVERAVY